MTPRTAPKSVLVFRPVLINDQSKRLKTENNIATFATAPANNVKRAVISADDDERDNSDRCVKMSLYLEKSLELFVNKRTKKLFVDPVVVIFDDEKKERMERQEYEELKSSPSASATDKKAVAFADDTTKEMVKIIRRHAVHPEKEIDDDFKKTHQRPPR